MLGPVPTEALESHGRPQYVKGHPGSLASNWKAGIELEGAGPGLRLE